MRLLLDIDMPRSEFEDRYAPGTIVDVGGQTFHTYRIIAIDWEHHTIEVEPCAR